MSGFPSLPRLMTPRDQLKLLHLVGLSRCFLWSIYATAPPSRWITNIPCGLSHFYSLKSTMRLLPRTHRLTAWFNHVKPINRQSPTSGVKCCRVDWTGLWEVLRGHRENSDRNPLIDGYIKYLYTHTHIYICMYMYIYITFVCVVVIISLFLMVISPFIYNMFGGSMTMSRNLVQHPRYPKSWLGNGC